MTQSLETTDRVFCDYAGYIISVTEKSIGLSATKEGSVEVWLPISQLRFVAYMSAGDGEQLRLNKRITAIELPRWLGIKSGLLAANQSD